VTSGASGIVCARLSQIVCHFPQLLARRIALNSLNFLFWLTLLGVPRVVPLALVKVAIDVALLVTVELGEAVILLVLPVSRPLSHLV
jgi:hypothetical protein